MASGGSKTAVPEQTKIEKRKGPLGQPLERYTVGWICVLPCELKAVRAMLDEEHEQLQSQYQHDGNSYVLGRIGKHYITIACLPESGSSRAAIAAKSMQFTFPNIRFGLLVGIGGGVPNEKTDIRLGDLVVSLPSEHGGGVIQYDLGRTEIDDFRRLGTLNKPPTLLRTTIANLRSIRHMPKNLTGLVNKVFERDKESDEGSGEEWMYPKTAEDILFSAKYTHTDNELNCDACVHTAEPGDVVDRSTRRSTNPRIHYGNIASGNSVMKNGLIRDRVAERDNVICFEMEAAGLMDDFPCIVIRGISNYADSHKNQKWQLYAAAVAAAYARSLLLMISPQAVENLESIDSE
ncbi:hypothetical protein ABW20_dc0105211 [Dactylellina cionopaga]|nr:hypothetical protein ABW20_dc0105211 [Dactylellina cionopaga]